MTRTNLFGNPGAAANSLEKERIFWFDAIRGLSAIGVCAGHLRAAAFVDFANVENPGVLQKLFYGLTSFGHQSVMVFFVLSGFFVGGSVLKNATKFNVQNYTISRLTRLWLVLIPALIFTMAVDLYLQTTAPEVLNGLYYKLWSSGPSAGDYSHSAQTFFGNIFFLQNIVVPIYGSNGPLWSLSCEFWYYVTFPSTLLIFVAKKPWATRVTALIITLFLAAALSVLPTNGANGLIFGYLIWLMGVGVYFFKDFIGKANRYLAVPFTLLFCAGLGYTKIHNSSAFLNPDIVVGFTFSLLTISLVYIEKPKQLPKIFDTFVSWISDISYSLYLFHFPILMILASIFHTGAQLQPNFKGFCLYIVELSLILALSALAWWLFERRTNTVRVLVERIFKRPTKFAG